MTYKSCCERCDEFETVYHDEDDDKLVCASCYDLFYGGANRGLRRTSTHQSNRVEDCHGSTTGQASENH